MSKKMLIDATHAEETRVVVVDGNKVEEFDFESENKRQLSGNIYLAKVTRVEPSLQAAFVDYGGNRHGFLAFSEIHPDYYQIPVADREALLAEEMAEAQAEAEEEEKPRRRRRSRSKSKAEKLEAADETVAEEPAVDDDAGADDEAGAEDDDGSDEDRGDDLSAETGDGGKAIPGMDVIDLDEERAVEAGEDDDEPYVAAEHAAETDETIESVADDDTAEEIRPKRKPRVRRYKIQEVIKVRQILLVQVVKEERGNKGAALTTYLSLAGRYCVLMPNTARGGGISRKITQAADRKKLKEIANEIEVPKGAGLIIRTAGAKRTKTEIKRDYEYLQRMWEQIRELTLKSIAPAKIYEEGNLIKRSIRDLYSREIDEVMVEGEAGYRVAKDFMKMIMPSHAKNVKHYHDAMPLFARYQVESYLAAMFNPTVQLKSGGYIVIGVTEALVAIDVNSGKATKEGSIEETALKTNLEAAEEVARQLRLRDLAGLIVIDFIDMEERRNNAAVEKRFKDKLKTDRARIQVGRISGFGLLEMSRQRLRPGMLEATTQPCPSCHGTGLIRSDDSLGLTILRQIEEEGVRRRSKEVLVKAPVSIVNFLMNMKREHIAQIEARYGMAVRMEADPFLISPDFSIEKFKTATRKVVEVAPVVSVDIALMEEVDEDLQEDEEEVDAVEEAEVVEASEDDKPKRKRRRRRRRRGKGTGEGESQEVEARSEEQSAIEPEEGAEQVESGDEAAAETPAEVTEDEKPKRRRSRGGRRKKAPAAEEASAEEAAADESAEVVTEDVPAEPVEAEAAEPEEKPKRKRATRSRKKKTEEPEATSGTEEPAEAPAQEPEPVSDVTPPETEPAAETPSPVVEEAATEPVLETANGDGGGDAPSDKPRRRGWWSMGR
ncbi:Rne/Rng family ribonuclease [Silicimonas sp. MF1-12-2]|uniref:Rne/Rng family ribonuclease n=1 Tax=Silicimonas sp. MF1-12-2 TaxID=3384793 RepID=UPI0039B3994E